MMVYFIQLVIAVETTEAKSVEHYGDLAVCQTDVNQHSAFQLALTNSNTNADLKKNIIF